MPSIPQAITLPILPARWDDPTAVRTWAEALYSSLLRDHQVVSQTVNALCKVDLAANMPATPDLNEIFFYTSDTDHLYVASAGVWVALT